MRPLHPDIVRQQISQLLLRFPELADDPEALELSLESETDAKDVLEQLIEREGDTASLICALDIRIAELRERSTRLANRQQAQRDLMFSIMQTANLPKLELPAATLSIRKGGVKVIVPDEDAVTDDFCRIKREVNKTAIKEALDTGAHLNFAVLERSPETLAIRRK